MESLSKRQRVIRACDTCRARKVKCDGVKPLCGRCRSYDYQCSWLEGPVSPRSITYGELQSQSLPISYQPIRNIVQAYESLIKSLTTKYTDPERAAVDLRIESIRQRLSNEVVIQRPTTVAIGRDRHSYRILHDFSLTPPKRYHGTASDIDFYNSVRRTFRPEEQDIESYEQEDVEKRDEESGYLPKLPSKALASSYVDVFFSTIHIAYPFICRKSFMSRYEKLWDNNGTDAIEPSWLALLYAVFAIGAYYVSFSCSSSAKGHTHSDYYALAERLAQRQEDKGSLTVVCLLISQCFYLLAVCRPDKCWTTLGLAIRVGQSIGLHVEYSDTSNGSPCSVVEKEMRRRAWYSMYILDRLLALQLGRPSAIHEDDFHVELPHGIDDRLFDLIADQIPTASTEEENVNEYCLGVIHFSRIVGLAMRQMYSPSQHWSSIERLIVVAKSLDECLLDWKRNLPRSLRFDIGHTFEKSVVRQRQRNMLAVKFHHLRALIHRPFLFSPWTRKPSLYLAGMSEREIHVTHNLRRICVSEAQKTAHLLHKVPDERSIVQDFPWWQMISCLICASSILLVASACKTTIEDSEDRDNSSLDDDAELCLKVFDALSVNSKAAHIARNMMDNLKKARSRILQEATLADENDNSQHENLHPNASSPEQATDGQIFPELLPEPDLDSYQNQQFWPCEMSDPLNWSAQFLDTPSQF